MNKETAQEKMDEKLLAGIQAGVAAVEFLIEVTEALELDPKTANIDVILDRISVLKATEISYENSVELQDCGEA